MSDNSINLTIQELAKEMKVKPSLLYEMSRRGEIPGMFRVGKKLIRINRDAFYAATRGEEKTA